MRAIARECLGCHYREYVSPAVAESRHTCIRCGGQFSAGHRTRQNKLPPGETTVRRAVCLSCPHNGLHERRGELLEGCGLLAKPCSVDRRRLNPQWTGPAGRMCWPPAPSKALENMPDHFPSLASPWVTEARLLSDSQRLVEKLARCRVREIVGVPRSGMFAASYIALRLDVPLRAMGATGIIDIAQGVRMRDRPRIEGATIVVDDSSASGFAIREIRRKLGTNPQLQYAAVYATPSAARRLDHYGRILPLPHWFSWNLFGNDRLLSGMHIGTDFDGVLCPDCSIDDDDDGDRYRNWMRRVPAKFRATGYEIPVVITARLERYRQLTMEWLTRHHFRVGRLVMGPWSSPQDRTLDAVSQWKAEQIVSNGCGLFVESSDAIARGISRQWPGPVVSTDGETTYVCGRGPQWPTTSAW